VLRKLPQVYRCPLLPQVGSVNLLPLHLQRFLCSTPAAELRAADQHNDGPLGTGVADSRALQINRGVDFGTVIAAVIASLACLGLRYVGQSSDVSRITCDFAGPVQASKSSCWQPERVVPSMKGSRYYQKLSQDSRQLAIGLTSLTRAVPVLSTLSAMQFCTAYHTEAT
jgi:hypothetical protein